MQEGLVRIVERERRGELEHLDGYAYRVAANILTDWHRRRTARHAGEHVSIEQVAPPANDIDPYRQVAGLVFPVSAPSSECEPCQLTTETWG